MKEERIYVKKLENPDFSGSKYIGKNLVSVINRGREGFPIEIMIGEVKEGCKGSYLQGFTMLESSFDYEGSELKRQTILGREYFGRHPYFGDPIDERVKFGEYAIYEIMDKTNVDTLREICNGDTKKLIIEETK